MKLKPHCWENLHIPGYQAGTGQGQRGKTGDQLAGLAAESAQERVAAKVVLSALTLADLREHPAVPYESDEVTRIIQDDVNETVYERIRGWTVSDLREWILDETPRAATSASSAGG